MNDVRKLGTVVSSPNKKPSPVACSADAGAGVSCSGCSLFSIFSNIVFQNKDDKEEKDKIFLFFGNSSAGKMIGRLRLEFLEIHGSDNNDPNRSCARDRWPISYMHAPQVLVVSPGVTRISII